MTYIICSGLSLGFTRVIGLWADAHVRASFDLAPGAELNFDHTPYILLCIGMLIGIGISFQLKILLTAKFFFKTNSIIHSHMLLKVSRAECSFFDKTPSGRIINRFSGDMAALDKRLYVYVFDFFTSFFDWVVILGYLSIKTFYLMIPTLGVIVFLYFIKVFFTRPLI